MQPRQLNYGCDIFLMIPIFGILLSVILYNKSFDKDIVILKDLFSSWKYKPIHLIQDSQQKTCSQIGMEDLINYVWPGITTGCQCSGRQEVDKCSQDQIRQGCFTINEANSTIFNKWKGSYLCGSSIKPKTYFEHMKAKPGDKCSPKHKPCGVLDTLGNVLCVPDNESCPLNSIEFKYDGKVSNLRMETSNENIKGTVLSDFRVVDGNLCINHIEKEFYEADYKLIKNPDFMRSCYTRISTDTSRYYNDTHYELLDSYPKSMFYEHNGLLKQKETMPGYPFDIKESVNLYAAPYIGWKKECMKKEFFSYMNINSTQSDKEIEDIVAVDNTYKWLTFIYAPVLALLFILGIVLLKYYLIFDNLGKIDITGSGYFVMVIIHLIFCVICGHLIVISEINLYTINSAKVSTDFFELIGNLNCSDDLTNGTMKYLSSSFLSYANKYFNLKVFSWTVIIASIIVLVMNFQYKKKFDEKREQKKKSLQFKWE
jgi:hypothetical protein